MSNGSGSSRDRPGWITPNEAHIRWLKFLEASSESSHRFKSGFAIHDQKVGYFQRGALYLFGSRPGIGKTSLLLALARFQALQGVVVHYLNLEMSVEEMWCRLYCLQNLGTNLKKVMEREFTDGQRAELIASVPALIRISPMWLEDSDFGAFVKLAKESVVPSSNSIIFVDYIGLFSMRGLGPGDNFVLISEVAKQLKLVARGLDIPIIAAAQLNRETEKRKSSRIILADLRGSGELENHAHAVFGLSRENVDRLDVAVLKNRNGPLQDYELRFDPPRAAVEEWE